MDNIGVFHANQTSIFLVPHLNYGEVGTVKLV